MTVVVFQVTDRKTTDSDVWPKQSTLGYEKYIYKMMHPIGQELCYQS